MWKNELNMPYQSCLYSETISVTVGTTGLLEGEPDASACSAIVSDNFIEKLFISSKFS